jgi:esterase/lipase/1-acyl-sn-glycerol-3-phosphate acyltransferase
MLFKSTNFILGILDKIFKSNFHATGIENIPPNPTIFVANHFTRAETFIVPYVLYKHAKRRVRSLADNNVFVGKLGEYLHKMETISTTDPKRNHIILSDLITGRRDWLIYPEGIMVKDKKITKMQNYVINSFPKGKKKVFTGSAVLALKTALLKRQYLNARDENNKKKLAELEEEFTIPQGYDISVMDTMIVPINITYYPVRPGHNKIEKALNRFFKKATPRIREELEIEGNILLNSDVIVNFGKPINVPEYIKAGKKISDLVPFVNAGIKNNLMINFFRYRLTNHFMEKIYNNVCLNFDHIFALTIYHYNRHSISKEHLKKLLYVNVMAAKELGKYHIHKPMRKGVYKLLIDNIYHYFDDIFTLAKAQEIITEKDGVVYINKKTLTRHVPFHEIRLKNTLMVFVNEVSLLTDIVDICKSNMRQSADELDDSVMRKIFKQDVEIFTKDYQKYFLEQESKPSTIGCPFFLEAPDSDVAVILSHGYKSAPEEVRELANYIHSLGVSVYAVRLAGHGTAPVNLRDVHWEDWYESFNRGYAALKTKYKKVIVAGFSTGGLLALLTAARRDGAVDGVISINAAIKLNDIRAKFVPTIKFWNELVHSKKLEKEYITDKPENPNINYAKNYLNGVIELKKLMHECNDSLKNITSPTLVIQGTKDPVVNPKSGDIIFKNIKAKRKELITPEFKRHVIVRGEDVEKVFEPIGQFLEKIM